MNEKTPSYLKYLRTAFSAVKAAGQDADSYASVAARVIDHMLVQRLAAPQLKVEAFQTMQALLPEAEKVLGNDATIAELEMICVEADADNFERFLQHLLFLQQKLVAITDTQTNAQARELAKAVLRIEADYGRKFEAAVAAQAKSSNTPVTTARNARQYDDAKLQRFIRETFPQERDVTIKSSRFIPGGYSKYILSITLENTQSLPQEIILRGDAVADYGGGSVVDEYRLIEAVSRCGVRAPRPLALEAAGTVFGGPFMLMEKLPGASIGNMLILPPPNKALCDDIATQLATIHQVPLDAVRQQFKQSPLASTKMLAWLDESVSNWKPLNISSPIFEAAFEWLRANATVNDKGSFTLLHGDYGLNNMLIHEGRLTAILDWEFSCLGNPAFDLGYFYYMAKALSSWEAFLDAYAKAGMPIPDEAQLNYNILFSSMRIGVMTCQFMNSFSSGAETGLAGAAGASNHFYNETLIRMSDLLDRVL